MDEQTLKMSSSKEITVRGGIKEPAKGQVTIDLPLLTLCTIAAQIKKKEKFFENIWVKKHLEQEKFSGKF
jgi:hypothetical protein